MLMNSGKSTLLWPFGHGMFEKRNSALIYPGPLAVADFNAYFPRLLWFEELVKKHLGNIGEAEN
jgi:hypothetical protein